MPTLVLVSQFARFTPKTRTICSTVRVLKPAPRAMLQHAPNVISITNFVIVENTAYLHLANYIQGSGYSHRGA